MQKITNCLWFDNQAEEAALFYTSIFKDSKILSPIGKYTKEGFEFHGKEEGSTLTVEFELNGQKFLALNGGPMFKFTEAISLMISCENQEEVDYYWEKLTDGGMESNCGWLKDKYGLSWQVVPSPVIEVLKDPSKSEKAMSQIFKMKKIDIAKVLDACN